MVSSGVPSVLLGLLKTQLPAFEEDREAMAKVEQKIQKSDSIPMVSSSFGTTNKVTPTTTTTCKPTEMSTNFLNGKRKNGLNFGTNYKPPKKR